MQIKQMLFDKTKKHQHLYLEIRNEMVSWQDALDAVVELFIIETKQKTSGKVRKDILQEVYTAYKSLKVEK